MLTITIDKDQSAVVWIFSGTVNTDDDYGRYVASIEALRSLVQQHGGGVGLLFAEAGNPPPNAVWRKRIAEASAHFPPGCFFILVSESLVIRSIATAINWLRPPTYKLTTAATLEEGLAWLSSHRTAENVAAVRRTFLRAQVESRLGKR